MATQPLTTFDIFGGREATLLETGPGTSSANLAAATEADLVIGNEVLEIALA